MKSFSLLYQLSFYFLAFIVLVIGGLIQFVFGISNTVLTTSIMVFMFAVYGLYALLQGKVLVNKYIGVPLAYILIILFTALVRGSDLISTLVYLIFPLLPLSALLFVYINNKEKFLGFETIFKFFFIIGIIQLPILLIQKRFYDTLIGFNNSGQQIDWYDFMFGSFFIKSDHSLGVFLLLLISTILYDRKRIAHIVVMPRMALVYLLISLFLTESNISKLIGVILVASTIIVPVYRKYGERLFFRIGVLLLVSVMGITIFSLKDKPIIQNRLGGPLWEQLSIERAERYYEEGTAKRFQIVMVAARRLPIKWIGDGPYSYFDIRSGKFTKAPHFSQLLWTYFDLGLLGLSVVVYYLWIITVFLHLKKGIVTIFFFGILVIYSFYTTIFSDISIFFSLLFILTREAREGNSNLSLRGSQR